MKVLAFDVETTGFSPVDDEITELGAVLWDTDRKQPLVMMSELVTGSKEIPPRITELTGIDNGMRYDYGIALGDALAAFSRMAVGATFYVAHNAPFDLGFLKVGFEKNGLGWPDRDAICTKADIKHAGSSSLKYAGADIGFLNPFPHRALFDVMACIKVAEHYGWDKLAALSSSPYVTLIAEVAYEDRDKARAAGFHWKAERKQWEMSTRAAIARDLKFDFRVSYLTELVHPADAPADSSPKQKRSSSPPADAPAFDESFTGFGRR